MNTKHYDVIVFGENLAGLVAAALLAARKYTVLLVRRVAGPERDLFFGQSAARDRLVVPNCFNAPVPSAVLRELNLGHRVRSLFKTVAPLFQYVDPSRRINVWAERTRLAMELQRDYGAAARPDDVGDLLSALEETNYQFDKLLVPSLPFHPDGLREKWELAGLVKEFARSLAEMASPADRLEALWTDTPFGRLVRRVEGFSSEAGDGFDARFGWRRAGLMLQELLYRVGGEGVDELLIETFEKRSGHILEQTALQELDVGRNDFTFHDAKNTYTAQFVVCAFDFFLLPQLFQDRKAEKFVSQTLERVRPAHVWLKVSFLTDGQLVPEGMSYNLFYDPPGADVPYFFARDPAAPEDAEMERVDLFYRAPAEAVGAEALGAIQGEAIDHAKDLMPFMTEHLRKVYLEKPAPTAPEDKLVALAGRRILYATRGDEGLFNGAPYTLPFKNAYLAGPEVLPELGMEGEFIAGWAVARQIVRKQPRKDDLR
ncbi:MAG: hypothetical protein C4523_00775 [Myxococcales bacterium]|nr:MAG: hypothetical protein C4523_00775 [Myxococcales bacterium]